MSALGDLLRGAVASCAAEDDAPMAELLQWHRATPASMPDADITVLLWIVTGNVGEWEAGWWDGEAWRLCESGGVVAGEVTHWAQPEGPLC